MQLGGRFAASEKYGGRKIFYATLQLDSGQLDSGQFAAIGMKAIQGILKSESGQLESGQFRAIGIVFILWSS